MNSEPKKPKNRYLLFLDEKKAEFVAKANGNYKDGISMAAKAFKELPENNPYVKKAKELKDAYDKDLEAFLQAGGDTAKTAKARAKEEEANIGQPKRPKNPFFLFLDERKAEFVAKANGNYKNGISTASKAFKALPDGDKKIYEDRFKEMQQQYEKDMQAFFDAGGTKKSRARMAKNEDEGAESKKRKKVDDPALQKAGA